MDSLRLAPNENVGIGSPVCRSESPSNELSTEPEFLNTFSPFVPLNLNNNTHSGAARAALSSYPDSLLGLAAAKQPLIFPGYPYASILRQGAAGDVATESSVRDLVISYRHLFDPSHELGAVRHTFGIKNDIITLKEPKGWRGTRNLTGYG